MHLCEMLILHRSFLFLIFFPSLSLLPCFRPHMASFLRVLSELLPILTFLFWLEDVPPRTCNYRSGVYTPEALCLLFFGSTTLVSVQYFHFIFIVLLTSGSTAIEPVRGERA